MGWIRDLLSSLGNSGEEVQQQNEERFPMHTYGIGYPIVLSRGEIEDFHRLLDIEENTPDSWDSVPFMSREDMEEIIDKSIDSPADEDITDKMPSPEERREEIREILELWRSQITGQDGAVWTTIGTDWEIKFYITECENRIRSEHDDFDGAEELDTVREIHDRIENVQDTRESAIVHKRNLPLEEPEES